MSAPDPAFRDLFPPTQYPLLRLLSLFIDLYEALQTDPSEAFTDAYQDWFEDWWNFWTREFGESRTPIAAFYAARCEAQRGRLQPSMLVIPTDSCKDPWRQTSREEEQLYMHDFKSWSLRRRNAVSSRKYRGGASSSRHGYAVPKIGECAQLRSEGFEPWNTSGVEYSVTHASRANPAPQVAHAFAPPPPSPTHTLPPPPAVDPPAFLEPPVHFSLTGPRHPHHFRSLAHGTLNILDRYSHRQRAIYGLD
ncbi:hypothetical protein JCM10049v2_007829 [Rhodotorula toruloides]